jgi:hypothetical protein
MLRSVATVPKPLAEIAIDADLVDREQLALAAIRADESGVPLVVALVREVGVDELALVGAIRRQIRVPLTDPASAKLDPDALRELPRDVCRRLRVLPLSISIAGRGPRLLKVAMADPTDGVAVAELEHLSNCRVEVTLMPLSAIEEMVERGYKAVVTEVMKRSALLPAGVGERTQKLAVEAEEGGPQPATMPFHRLSDEADLGTKLQALLDILLDKGLLSDDEFEERVRQLMKRQSGD